MEVRNTPSKEEIRSFWEDIYESDIKHGERAVLIEKLNHCGPFMKWGLLTEEISSGFETAQNWYMPGVCHM